MPTITPEFLGTSFIVMLVTYGILLVYQIYMMILGQRQAKVKGLIEEQNKILIRIEKSLKEIISKSFKK